MNDKANILVVDDSSESLALLVKILTQAGYQVYPANSGELALEAVAINKPDLILLDVCMKGVDGLEVCRRLKAHQETQSIPIILISAFADVKEWVLGLQLGAADYVTKPFQTEELLTRIKIHLSLRRANLSLEQQSAALHQTNEQLLSEIAERHRVEEELRPNLERAERSRRALLSILEDQKQVEESLRTHQKQLEEAQRIGQLGNWEWDVATNVTTWSDEMCRIFGHDRNSFTFTLEAFMEAPHPDDRTMVRAIVQKSIETHEPTDFDFRIITPNGELRWVHAISTMLVDENGKPKRVFGTCQDITERKKAEESRLLLTTALESTANGVTITDHQGNIVWVNKAFTAMTGYTWTDVLGQNPRILKSGKQDDSFYRDLWETISVGNVWTGELINKKKDGGLYNDGTTITPLKNVNGKITNFIAIKQDITERKKAEKESKMLAQALKSITECISITDLDNKVLFVNEAFLKTYGYEERELLGKNIGMVRSDKTEKGADILLATIQGSWQGELVNRKKDGTEFAVFLSTSVVTDDKRKAIALIGVATDITERTRSEEALKESEEKYKSLFERNLAGTFVSTPDGNILDCNPAYMQMFGFESRKKALSTNIGQLYGDPRNREQILTTLQAHEKVENMLMRMVRIDGAPMYVIANVVGRFDKHGQLVQKTGYLIDDTKRHRLEAELIQSQKLESLGILAGGIAHDFNNILGILMGHVSLLDRIKDNPELHTMSIAAIDTALKRGTGLVRQLLTFARKTDVVFEPVFINDIVKEILKLIGQTFAKTLEIVTNLSPQLPAVVADGGQIHQVLLNLCVNARDAMPAGGRLQIQTNVVDGDRVRKRFPIALSDRYVVIEVRDTGTGMDEATKTKIFEPFFTTKESGKGTGLGLAVVFGVVQTHKGFIDVESEIGKGSTFRVYLPVEVVQPTAPNKRKGGFEETAGGHETILFVEDEPLLYETSKIVLISKGYKVLYAKDGLEAIDEFRKHFKEIQLVLTDVDLPKLGGEKLVNTLLEINPKLKIIFASGYIEPKVKAKILKSGAKAFLAKPYDHVAMLAKVREVLDAKE
jgi:two-component system cell cycle sensor histidine kinase/response regulator CckA